MRTSVTIASGGTISTAGDVGPENFFYGIEMSAGWDAANITFQVSNDDGATFKQLRDDGGTVVTITTATAGDVMVFRDTIFQLLKMFRHIKLVASAAQNGGARTLFLLSRSRNG